MQLLFSKNNRKTSSKKKKIRWVKGADCVRRRSHKKKPPSLKLRRAEAGRRGNLSNFFVKDLLKINEFLAMHNLL
jgi:hypothetical protein